jgi:hypothetical protein
MSDTSANDVIDLPDGSQINRNDIEDSQFAIDGPYTIVKKLLKAIAGLYSIFCTLPTLMVFLSTFTDGKLSFLSYYDLYNDLIFSNIFNVQSTIIQYLLTWIFMTLGSIFGTLFYVIPIYLILIFVWRKKVRYQLQIILRGNQSPIYITVLPTPSLTDLNPFKVMLKFNQELLTFDSSYIELKEFETSLTI